MIDYCFGVCSWVLWIMVGGVGGGWGGGGVGEFNKNCGGEHFVGDLSNKY